MYKTKNIACTLWLTNASNFDLRSLKPNQIDMNTNKIIMGGIVGGIAFFLLGWLIYGIVLMDYMSANSNTCAMRGEEDMVWWAMIASNIVTALFLALVFSWANVDSVMKGVKTAAMVSFLLALGISLQYYSMTTMYTNLTAVVVDVVASVAMFSITGAIIAWIMNR